MDIRHINNSNSMYYVVEWSGPSQTAYGCLDRRRRLDLERCWKDGRHNFHIWPPTSQPSGPSSIIGSPLDFDNILIFQAFSVNDEEPSVDFSSDRLHFLQSSFILWPPSIQVSPSELQLRSFEFMEQQWSSWVSPNMIIPRVWQNLDPLLGDPSLQADQIPKEQWWLRL